METSVLGGLVRMVTLTGDREAQIFVDMDMLHRRMDKTIKFDHTRPPPTLPMRSSEEEDKIRMDIERKMESSDEFDALRNARNNAHVAIAHARREHSHARRIIGLCKYLCDHIAEHADGFSDDGFALSFNTADFPPELGYSEDCHYRLFQRMYGMCDFFLQWKRGVDFTNGHGTFEIRRRVCQ